MIHFKTVRWKNLLSYGNQFTELQLDRSPSTMITGVNGAGKSTVLEALCFGMFGKPFRKINKPQLINTKNGRELVVEIEFNKGTDEYLVRRGTKPEVFEVYKNGQLQNQPGASRDYQAALENTVLKFDYSAFTQLVAVGKATHVSFMKLDSNRRRQFIESILSLLVFSNMNRLHTIKSNQLRERVIELRGTLTVAGERVTMARRYIKDLEAQAKQTLESDRAEREIRISLLEEEVQTESVKLRALSEELRDVSAMVGYNQTLREFNSIISKLHQKYQTSVKERLALFESEQCIACGQVINQDEREARIEKLTTNIQKTEVGLAELDVKIVELTALVSSLEKDSEFNESTRRDIAVLENSIRSRETTIQTIKSELNTQRTFDHEKIDSERAKLDEYTADLARLVEEREESAKQTEYFGLIGTMLKDSGIKSTIIKRFIPIINHYINQNLAKLDFFAKFTLDENFEETIQARGIDTLSYHNFSEGEKLRIDMAILLAWREIAKVQNNMTTNLLIFDEVFDASIDVSGADALASLLNELKGINLFIITHTPEKISDKVRSSITFYQEKGFSKMKV